MGRLRNGEGLAFIHDAAGRDVSECILYPGAKCPLGYGYCRTAPTHLAHRAVFLIKYGYLPTVVRHKCDTPSCINPNHLLAGTHKDNTRDAIERGRFSRGDRHSTKLSSADVADIRLRILPGKGRWQRGNAQDLADEYNVSRRMINRIVLGDIWQQS